MIWLLRPCSPTTASRGAPHRGGWATRTWHGFPARPRARRGPRDRQGHKINTVEHLTPKQIVAELDKYIVGQADAKRAVAVAVRNRWRRQQLADEGMRNELTGKNILMIGPTGVGKTEIARRLAGLTGAPFIKVEATKYTEVGYHGRDVESMIRDLLDSSIALVRDEMTESVKAAANEQVEERLLDYLLPGVASRSE